MLGANRRLGVSSTSPPATTDWRSDLLKPPDDAGATRGIADGIKLGVLAFLAADTMSHASPFPHHLRSGEPWCNCCDETTGPARCRLLQVLTMPFQIPSQLSAWTIPLNTRRSSTRDLPRTPVESRGSIQARCAPENLKKSAISPLLTEAVNHAPQGLGACYRVRIPVLRGLDSVLTCEKRKATRCTARAPRYSAVFTLHSTRLDWQIRTRS